MRISDWSSDVCSSDLTGRHDEQRAVVAALLADAPMAAELVAEVVDPGALQRGQGDHDELVGGRLLVAGEQLGEAARPVRAQQIGTVDHAAGERRNLERGDGSPGTGESPDVERRKPQSSAAPAKRSPGPITATP